MAAQKHDVQPPAWRGTASLPVRPAIPWQRECDTATPRIPVILPGPSVPGGRFAPTAFAGEAVPFRVTAFREGH
ncbi:MAG: alpha-1,4-glucan--maltose-1-phosphate maltosyltransferase, partial [Microbacterium sp.]|nr:alpha-1,4-glucan--maltose-1-phosphate maltosyltransferase [Microbacterium sp.]